MSAAVADPPANTGFLNSPEFAADLDKALAADGKGVVPAVIPAPANDGLKQPEPPKPAAAAAAKPEGDEFPEDIKSEGARSSWKKLKESKLAIEKERDTERQALQKLRAEYEEFKTKAPGMPKLDEIPEYKALKASVEAKDKELGEYSERLRVLDITNHPKFKAYFDTKLNRQMEVAKEIGGDKLVAALKLPEGDYKKSQLKEIAGELDALDAAKLGAVLMGLGEIESEKAQEIARARESQEQLRAQQQSALEKQRGEMEEVFKRVTGEVTSEKEGLPVFREREGDEEWNKGVKERLALVDAARNGQFTTEEAVRAMYWAAAAPQLLQQLNGSLGRIAELEKTITDLRAAGPGAGGSGGDGRVDEKYVPGLAGMMDEIAKVLPGAR